MNSVICVKNSSEEHYDQCKLITTGFIARSLLFRGSDDLCFTYFKYNFISDVCFFPPKNVIAYIQNVYKAVKWICIA